MPASANIRLRVSFSVPCLSASNEAFPLFAFHEMTTSYARLKKNFIKPQCNNFHSAHTTLWQVATCQKDKCPSRWPPLDLIATSQRYFVLFHISPRSASHTELTESVRSKPWNSLGTSLHTCCKKVVTVKDDLHQAYSCQCSPTVMFDTACIMHISNTVSLRYVFFWFT